MRNGSLVKTALALTILLTGCTPESPTTQSTSAPAQTLESNLAPAINREPTPVPFPTNWVTPSPSQSPIPSITPALTAYGKLDLTAISLNPQLSQQIPVTAFYMDWRSFSPFLEGKDTFPLAITSRSPEKLWFAKPTESAALQGGSLSAASVSIHDVLWIPQWNLQAKVVAIDNIVNRTVPKGVCGTMAPAGPLAGSRQYLLVLTGIDGKYVTALLREDALYYNPSVYAIGQDGTVCYQYRSAAAINPWYKVGFLVRDGQLEIAEIERPYALTGRSPQKGRTLRVQLFDSSAKLQATYESDLSISTLSTTHKFEINSAKSVVMASTGVVGQYHICSWSKPAVECFTQNGLLGTIRAVSITPNGTELLLVVARTDLAAAEIPSPKIYRFNLVTGQLSTGLTLPASGYYNVRVYAGDSSIGDLVVGYQSQPYCPPGWKGQCPYPCMATIWKNGTLKTILDDAQSKSGLCISAPSQKSWLNGFVTIQTGFSFAGESYVVPVSPAGYANSLGIKVPQASAEVVDIGVGSSDCTLFSTSGVTPPAMLISNWKCK